MKHIILHLKAILELCVLVPLLLVLLAPTLVRMGLEGLLGRLEG
jgi:hypothetical protein